MRYFVCLFLLPLLSPGQFAPPAGQAGTAAMYKDSSAFVAWANFCMVTRGLQDISNSANGYPTIGDSSKVIGVADNSVVSLGDGGYAVCTFQNAISDGPGPDFAVFENSFSDDYLEFGFVEVSSDGVNFFRFPVTCNIQDTVQTGSFGTCDARLVNNLAGKYRALYGTPFDLQELQGTAGLNINNITHVKIIDVVGSINATYATYDKNNHKVNDPWPTAFASSGFDLDAVGVIHDVTNGVATHESSEITVYPNPSNGAGNVELRIKNVELVREWLMQDARGVVLKKEMPEIKNGAVICDVSDLAPGMYFFSARKLSGTFTKKLIITQ